MAAAVSVTAVGAFQLYKHWDQLANIFEEKKPFPKAAGDLVGLNEQLEKTKKELEELQKLSTVTVSQENRVNQLRQTERDVNLAIEQQKALENLNKLKSKEQDAVSKAFEEAVKQSGGGSALADLRPMMDGVDDLVKEIMQGSVQAYDRLIKGLEDGAGNNSPLLLQMRNLRPFKAPAVPVDAFEQAAKDAKVANDLAAEQFGIELEKQGRELGEDFLHEMGDEARKGISEGIGGRLKDILVKTRANGSKGEKEIKYLTDAIAEEITRMMPELARFPAMVANLAKEMARTLQDEVNKAIDELMRLEGLTKQEALRRLNQQRAEKVQDKTEALATDAFKQAAATEARRFAQLNPGEVPATPRDIASRAQQMQDQLKELGVTPKQQVQIGGLLNNPRAQRLIPGAMGALQDRGFGEAEAMRALPEFFRQLKGGQAGIEHAADRLAAAAERAERAAFQRAALQATAIPGRARPQRGPRSLSLRAGGYWTQTRVICRTRL